MIPTLSLSLSGPQSLSNYYYGVINDDTQPVSYYTSNRPSWANYADVYAMGSGQNGDLSHLSYDWSTGIGGAGGNGGELSIALDVYVKSFNSLYVEVPGQNNQPLAEMAKAKVYTNIGIIVLANSGGSKNSSSIGLLTQQSIGKTDLASSYGGGGGGGPGLLGMGVSPSSFIGGAAGPSAPFFVGGKGGDGSTSNRDGGYGAGGGGCPYYGEVTYGLGGVGAVLIVWKSEAGNYGWTPA